MKKSIILIVVGISLLIFGIVSLNISIHSAINTVNKNETEFKETSLKYNVIYQKDTLQIINYSIWNNTYTLSNGVNVNSIYVKSNKILKK